MQLWQRLAQASLLGLSALAWADDPPAGPHVEITSFEYPSGRDRTAEICGKVTNAPLPGLVKLEVDYTHADLAAIYNAVVGPEGTFCVVAVSLRHSVRPTYMPWPAR